MSEEATDKFAAAVAAATGERTAADAAASANSMHAQLQAFEARVQAGDYNDAPHLIESTRAKLLAITRAAGIAPPPPPKTIDQLASEHRAASFSLPDAVNENLMELINKDLERVFAKGDDHIKAEAARLREELGPKEYDAMVADTKAYHGDRWQDVYGASEPTLRTFASQYRRNRAKRGQL